MSEQLNEELGKLIQKAAIDGTLSKSAVEQFTAVLEDNRHLAERVNRLDFESKKKGVELTQKTARLSHAEERLKEVDDREKAVAERESEAEVLAMSLKYEQKRVEDHKSMVGLIFRNTVLKKQVMSRNDSHTDVNGATRSSYDVKEDLQEEEE